MSSTPAAAHTGRAASFRRDLARLLGRLSLATAAAALAMFLFTYLAHEMAEGDTRRFDEVAVQFFGERQTPLFHAVMTGISWMAGSWGMTLTVTAALIGFWRVRRLWPEGVALLIAAAGGLGLIIALKALFHRPRPAEIFSHLGYSFPSGHSFFALTIYGMLAYRLTRSASPRFRILIWATAVALILLVGFSRVFLGVHYPSDVIAGFLVALPWLWGCLALPTRLGRHRPEDLVSATQR